MDCPKCGYSHEEEKEIDEPEMEVEAEADEEMSVKDEVLKELIEIMQDAVGSKFKK